MAHRPQGALFRTLDTVLGRVSHVRILRVLSLHGGPLTPPELAWRSGLSRAGAWNALDALEEVGIARSVGTGGSVPYALVDAHPLTPSIRAIFEEEAARVDEVLAGVRDAAASLDPAPLGVWLFGSAARGEERPDSDLDIAVVAEDEPTARRHAEALREVLMDLADRYAVRPSVISLSRTEVDSMRNEGREFWQRLVRDGVPLFGMSPEAFDPAA